MSDRTFPVMPGVPAAGHVTGGGYWHPGRADGCVKCPTPDRFGVLFSHASETTVPGLVHGDYRTQTEACHEARRTTRPTGTLFMLVQWRNGRWLTGDGFTPAEALRRGTDNGFRGWWK